MTRRAMSAQDSLWLRLDRPQNVLAVVSVLWTHAPVPPADLRRLVSERLVVRYPVLRRRPIRARGLLSGAAWEDDPDFDLDRHVRVSALPTPGTTAALQACVGTLRSAPFDLDHPLWEVRLLQGYDAGSALVLRVHHSVADVVRTSRLLLGLLDPVTGPGGMRGRVEAAPWCAVAHGTGHRRPGPSAVLSAPVHPLRALDAAAGLALTALHSAGSLVTLLAWANPATPWTGEPGTAKTAAWGDPVSVDVLARIAHATGTTVRDMCLALVAGAVRRRLAEQWPARPPTDLAWVVPVGPEPIDVALPVTLGNHGALVLVVLPLAGGGFRARLAGVHARMRRARASWEPWLTAAVQEVISHAPGGIATTLGRCCADKAVGVLTEVAGPRRPMALAGAPVTGVVAWAPCIGRQVVTVCLSSYAGRVFIGFGADDRRVGDAARLVEAFRDELAAALAELAADGLVPHPGPAARARPAGT